MENDTALLVVDVQNDFCSGGSMPIAFGDEIVPTLNGYIELFRSRGATIIATRDWHPPESARAARFGGKWPQHCIRGRAGADFHPGLRLPPGTIVVSKGISPASDGYSAFSAVTGAEQPLVRVLQERGIRHIFIGGLATDYCVRESALEARARGYVVTVLLDAVKGAGDEAAAVQEMRAAGVDFETFADVAAGTG